MPILEMKKDADLALLINQHVQASRAEWAPRVARWTLAEAYMTKAARRFTSYDPLRGRVVAEFTDEQGRFETEVPELMSQTNRVVGHIVNMDLAPAVKVTGASLSTLRQRAVSEILFGHLYDDADLREAKVRFAYLFSYLGCCGLRAVTDTDPSLGVYSSVEVVHPVELHPFPLIQTDYTKQRGWVRNHLVTLDELKMRFPGKNFPLKDMDVFEESIGAPEEINRRLGASSFTAINNTSSAGDISTSSSRPDTVKKLVKVNEVWLTGPQGRLLQYIATSGSHLIENITYEEVSTVCPIQVPRFYETGSPYGAGIFDLLFSLSRHYEVLVKSLVNNVKDLQRYPVTLMPQGVINFRKSLKEDGVDLPLAFYMPNARSFPIGADPKPITIAPHNPGEVPRNTAQFMKELIEGISPVRDFLEEKGRADSFAALNLVAEAATAGITTGTSSLVAAWSSVHKSNLGRATLELLMRPQKIRVKRLHTGLAGAVINFDDNSIKFGGDNPIPSLSSLEFSVRSVSGSTEATRKKEAFDLTTAGLRDTIDFIIHIIQEGIHVDMWIDGERAAVESITQDILTMYGDGRTSGQVVVSPYMTRPDIQMRILEAFMGSPAMRKASVQVQDNFAQFIDTMRGFVGGLLPEPLSQSLTPPFPSQQRGAPNGAVEQ